MDIFERMLLDNEAWAEEKIESTPNFFKRLSHQQTPEVLWIGCSDSRVPSEIVVNAEPGEMLSTAISPINSSPPTSIL